MESIETAAARFWTRCGNDAGGEGTVEISVVETGVVEELSSYSGRTLLTAPDGWRGDLHQVLQRPRHCAVYQGLQHRHCTVADDWVPQEVQLELGLFDVQIIGIRQIYPFYQVIGQTYHKLPMSVVL